MKKIAIGKHIRFCDSVVSIGLKTNYEDYDINEASLIKNSGKIYYPTSLYESLFTSLGKRVFPRNYYSFMGNKIRQTLLFQWLDIPHPRTKIYYGRNRFNRILEDFSYPFVAKQPIGGSQGKGVFLINSDDELIAYLKVYKPAYIQEYLKTDKDMRVVIFAGRVINAYWRIGKEGDFRHNVSQGANISFNNIPDGAIDFALDVASRCGFDEVGLDIIEYNDSYYVLEANMVYGLEGFRAKGVEWKKIVSRLCKEGYF